MRQTDRFWHKVVHVGIFVQKIIFTPRPQNFKLFHYQMRFFEKVAYFMLPRLRNRCTLNTTYWAANTVLKSISSKNEGFPILINLNFFVGN